MSGTSAKDGGAAGVRSSAGRQNGRLVPCMQSHHHGHHPEHELCSLCDAPRLYAHHLLDLYYEAQDEG